MPAPNPNSIIKIKESGKDEFLQKGYKNASMRSIARNAGLTTGAIYGYFSDKAALFKALVEPYATDAMNFFIQTQIEFDIKPTDEKIEQMHDYTENKVDVFMEYIYDHLDAFRLIINSSGGTEYETYLDKIVDLEEKYISRFIKTLCEHGYTVEIDPEVVHLLSSAIIHGMFQVVAHNIPRNRAMRYIYMLKGFNLAGWEWLLKL